MNTNPSKSNSILKNSVTTKVAIIGVLILLLLIPMSMIESIIVDREHQREKAIKEVSNKWAGKQTITGPVLTIPMSYEVMVNKQIVTKKENLHILPEDVTYKSTIEPKKLHRSIYEIVVYQSGLVTNGNFKLPDFSIYTDSKKIHFDKAYISIGISDLKGIKNKIALNFNGEKTRVTPGVKVNFIDSGITIPLPDLTPLVSKIIPFDFNMKLQGSQSISFVPVGNNTKVEINSPWDSPSFFGNFLPDNRIVTKDGFKASWNILELNRNFPQVWLNNEHTKKMQNAAFGVNLKLPMDDYQKTIRSAKYSVMIISLTFIMFFLVEALNKKKIHPLQYILIGAALCIFYILLVSISEHSNFNLAYLISAAAVISLITLYAHSAIKEFKITALILFVLLTIYGFVFVILQLSDYALLMGSIGLLVIIGLTMYATRNINWYTINFENNPKNPLNE